MKIRDRLWFLFHRRCEAMAINRLGVSVMDNPLSVYMAAPERDDLRRCKGRISAAVKGKYGHGVVNICAEHAELLAADIQFRVDVNRNLLPRETITIR